MADTTSPTQASLSGDGYGSPPPGDDWTTGQSGMSSTSWWTGDADTAKVNTWNEYVDAL